MDTGNGSFEFVKHSGVNELESGLEAQLRSAQERNPNHGGTFYVGQNLELNGSKFRVLAITKKTMTLRVLPK